MIRNKSDLIIELAIANVTATVKILNERIERENDENRINELKKEREILIQVLKDLAVNHRRISLNKANQINTSLFSSSKWFSLFHI